jgi:hypothetical protein
MILLLNILQDVIVDELYATVAEAKLEFPPSGAVTKISIIYTPVEEATGLFITN